MPYKPGLSNMSSKRLREQVSLRPNHMQWTERWRSSEPASARRASLVILHAYLQTMNYALKEFKACDIQQSHCSVLITGNELYVEGVQSLRTRLRVLITSNELYVEGVQSLRTRLHVLITSDELYVEGVQSLRTPLRVLLTSNELYVEGVQGLRTPLLVLIRSDELYVEGVQSLRAQLCVLIPGNELYVEGVQSLWTQLHVLITSFEGVQSTRTRLENHAVVLTGQVDNQYLCGIPWIELWAQLYICVCIYIYIYVYLYKYIIWIEILREANGWAWLGLGWGGEVSLPPLHPTTPTHPLPWSPPSQTNAGPAQDGKCIHSCITSANSTELPLKGFPPWLILLDTMVGGVPGWWGAGGWVGPGAWGRTRIQDMARPRYVCLIQITPLWACCLKSQWQCASYHEMNRLVLNLFSEILFLGDVASYFCLQARVPVEIVSSIWGIPFSHGGQPGRVLSI